jgi:hypothetical protein
MQIHSRPLSLLAAYALCMTVACGQSSSNDTAAPQSPAPAAAPAPAPETAPAAQPAAPAAPAPGTQAPPPAAPPAAERTAPQPGAPAAPAPAPVSEPVPQPAPKPEPPPPPPPKVYTLKAGTPLRVFTTSTLSTKTNKTGETFTATLAEPIVHDEWVIAKEGATVRGVITESDPGGRVKGTAAMGVTINRLTLADGRTVTLAADTVGGSAKSTKGKDAKKIGIAAGVGAAIGAIAGGGKGAAIGAGVGGGAGTAHTLATHGEAATIPAETELTFVLTKSITVKERR